MKTSLVLSIAVTILLYGCIFNAEPLDINEELSFLVEPYGFEHYEFNTSERDTSLRVFINRELSIEEVPSIGIYLLSMDGLSDVFVHVDIDSIVDGNILEIKLPLRLESRSLRAPYSDDEYYFSVVCRDLIENKQEIKAVVFSHSSLQPNMFFRDGQKIFRHRFLTNFESPDSLPEQLFDRFSDLETWRWADHHIFEGTFDEYGMKQGAWKWYYSNGNLQAVGQFKNNIPFGKFRTFYFEGELMEEFEIDTLSQKPSSVSTFYQNGVLKKFEDDSSKVFYSREGEVLGPEYHW